MRMTCVLVVPLVALSACAQPPPNGPAATTKGARQCFWASDVTSFGDAGPKRVIANVYNQEKWELSLASGCSNANWAMKIGIVSRGSQEICVGEPAELLMPMPGGGTQRCLVSNVRKLPMVRPQGPQ